MMVNLFGPETFYQAADTTHTIYLMINKIQLSTGKITLRTLEERLNQIYQGNYIIDDL